MKWLAAVLVVAVACNRGPTPATPEQRAEIDRLFKLAVSNAHAADELRHQKLVAAAAIPLVEGTAPCPIHVDPTWDQRVEHVGAVIAEGPKGQRLLYVEHQAENVGYLLGLKKPAPDQTPERLVAWSGTLVTLDWWDWDLTLIEERVAPGAAKIDNTSGHGFSGEIVGSVSRGTVAGRAFLYSYKDHEVVCGGRFTAKSAESLEVVTDPGSYGDRDGQLADRASYQAHRDLDRQFGCRRGGSTSRSLVPT